MIKKMKNMFAIAIFLIISQSSEAISSETEAICFHSNQVASSSESQVIRGPIGKAGPIGRAGPPGEPGRDAVCNYDTAQFDEIKARIDELESGMINSLKCSMRQLIANDGGSYNNFCSLGVQSGGIIDSQMTASSEHSDDWRAYKGRLNSATGWYPASGTERVGQWIQVDLLTPTTVTGIVTQGRGDGGEQWTKAFQIYYGDHEGSLVPIQYADGSYMVFEGNEDRNTKKINLFPKPVITRYIRLVVVSYHTVHVVRMELLGC